MNTSRNNLRKAAILVASLDHRTADMLLEQMSEEEAAIVCRAAVELSEIDLSEREHVIDEFFGSRHEAQYSEPSNKLIDQRQRLVPNQNPAGLDLDGYLAKLVVNHRDGTGDESARQTIVEHETIETPPRPFCFLDQAKPAELVPYLQREQPQTIAVVLSHLEPPQAAKVLEHLPQDTAAAVVLRLSDLDEMHAEAVGEIEEGLQSWLYERERVRKRRTAGVAAVQKILQASESNSRDGVLGHLTQLDAPLAAKLMEKPASVEQAKSHDDSSQAVARENYAFAAAAHESISATVDSKSTVHTSESISAEFIWDLEDDDLANVFRTVDESVLTLALATVDTKQQKRAWRILGRPTARRLRRRLEDLGPTRLADLDASVQQLAKIAQQFTTKELTA